VKAAEGRAVGRVDSTFPGGGGLGLDALLIAEACSGVSSITGGLGAIIVFCIFSESATKDARAAGRRRGHLQYLAE
jgi:hypothetical protein